MFQFCVLGSGSSGNSVAFWDSENLFLIDAGFSCKETVRRLGQAGLDVENLDAILISHEHVDHVSGVRVLQKRFGTRALSTEPVHRWLDAKFGMSTEPELVPSIPEHVGNFTVTPFEVCHDASQTVGFTVCKKGSKVSLATDLGHVTPGVRARFMDSDAIIIESNHDVQMLKEGPYPAFLKKRILGRQGHLSNAQSAEMLVSVVGEKTIHIALAHLSQENNKPEIAQEESEIIIRASTGRKPKIVPASQSYIGNIIKIR
ncbi:MAG: MBL fold metallo-hydrolase [Candidatus Thermoplasmatota archaeon]|nr:MBL fold metallo-hydrolase [Euryarchaeota archaeon]MBU4032987.1 MBL fold metallo-hydrolase [Candidatus Thermoplasmatota archaeon]MBU4071186.1 MBL fold metallo-hydrolase [Candidatus Thermoplasmatota archaeon]MBU4143597.1 MBL fold metallo-hydrolase [Candidatus Thermoplasmatota archaeon]MBU4591350.1 MBL fold metallo-hydrolase [Candidatus Thermoplasmatota archaeon]